MTAKTPQTAAQGPVAQGPVAQGPVAQGRLARAKAAGVGPLRLLWRLAVWRICAALGLAPVIRAHGTSRLRIYPSRGDHGIAKGVFLLRAGYEPSVRAVIDATLRPGDVALDIGANMGLWTLRMAECVGPQGRVLAFEPGPVTQTRLRANIALSGHRCIEVHGVALGDAPGTLTLHTPQDAGSASLGVLPQATHVTPVRIDRLDTLWQAAGAPQVALVKLDVEGAEPMVLAGASAFFAACRPLVACEINPEALARLGYRPADVLGFFASHGYRAMIDGGACGALVPHGPATDASVVQDIVFVPEFVPEGAGQSPASVAPLSATALSAAPLSAAPLSDRPNAGATP